jgi:3-dehydroquinate synthetase
VTRFGSGIRSDTPQIVAALRPTSVVCVADDRVVAHHGWPAEGARIPIEAKESNKNLKEWERLLDELVSKHIDRDGLLLALGGGVTLDLAGFVAATYLRGIRWIALPTTLLAQVDAAHGGKTGVDHDTAKNLVGAFHPPEEVLADTDYLATLPDREVRGGLAEVVKHGILGAPDLLDKAGRDDPARFVEEAARVKLEITARDPLEKGERRLLDLGHTLGHALERASGYGLHHGEAVALGLRGACGIAEAHCGFSQGAVVVAALDRCGLPAKTDVPHQAVRDALRHDKKRRGPDLRWVLPRALGDVGVYDDVPEELVETALASVLY